MAVRDIAPGLKLDADRLIRLVHEVPTQQAAHHERGVDVLEVVDGVVLDVAALGDVLDQWSETQVRVRQQVARQLGGEEVDVGSGSIEIAGTKAPQRHCRIVRRAVVVRRVACTGTDRPIDRPSRRGHEQRREDDHTSEGVPHCPVPRERLSPGRPRSAESPLLSARPRQGWRKRQ